MPALALVLVSLSGWQQHRAADDPARLKLTENVGDVVEWVGAGLW